MSKEIEMKMELLDQLKKLMMGGAGDKFKPKAVEVEIMHLPSKDEEEEVDEMPEEVEAEDDEENPKKKKTLREFLSSLD